MPYPLLHAVSVLMSSPFVLQWVCGWGATFAHTVPLRLMPVVTCLHLQTSPLPNCQISGSEWVPVTKEPIGRVPTLLSTEKYQKFSEPPKRFLSTLL